MWHLGPLSTTTFTKRSAWTSCVRSSRRTDIAGPITAIRALGIRRVGVLMPFKEAAIPLIDGLDPSAAVIQSVNTIVHTGAG